MNKPPALPVNPVYTPAGQRTLTLGALLGALSSIFLVAVLVVAYLTRLGPNGSRSRFIWQGRFSF